MTVGASLPAWAAAIQQGDRAALARAITLIESARSDHRAQARELLAALPQSMTGGHRVGITGAPGAGKSSLIDVLGHRWCDEGHRVAVLAIDPSSVRSGGSVLGDKTRMTKLARHTNAFVRPTPTGGMLGGLARRTRETILLCEAAGYDRIVVETVGVGQSEIAVADVVDTVVVLTIPGAGDGLQGIKRGIVETADLVVVNKADGDNLVAAQRALAELTQALALVPGRHAAWSPRALVCSAVTGDGIAELAEALSAHLHTLHDSGEWVRVRGDQREAWMQAELRDAVERALADDPELIRLRANLVAEVRMGQVTPENAAQQLLAAFRAGPSHADQG